MWPPQWKCWPDTDSFPAQLRSWTNNPTVSEPCTPIVFEVYSNTLNWFLNFQTNSQSLQDLLPSIHTIFVFLHGIYSLRGRLHNPDDFDTCCPVLDSSNFSWGGLAATLNRLMETAPMDSATLEFARQRTLPFPSSGSVGKILPEDHYMRGMPWTLDYFPEYWFQELEKDEERYEEDDEVRKIRVKRVQWLSLYMALHTAYIEYDLKTRLFRAPDPGPSLLYRLLSRMRMPCSWI